jgi:transposase-like protein
MTEREAIETLKAWRWPDGRIICPRCASSSRLHSIARQQFVCTRGHYFALLHNTPFAAHKKSFPQCAGVLRIMMANPALAPMDFARQTGWSYRAAHSFVQRWRKFTKEANGG